MQRDNQHPPFWGLNLGLEPEARVLIVDDSPDERRPVLERLVGETKSTWAVNMDEVSKALEEHGSFDVYCLDYDLGSQRGGWLAAGRMIRDADPASIAKIVLIHSANIAAREYISLFPTAIFIQWDVLATILGVRLVDHNLIEAVLSKAGRDASVEQLKDAVRQIRGDHKSGGGG